jgi:hypothetical protein
MFLFLKPHVPLVEKHWCRLYLSMCTEVFIQISWFVTQRNVFHLNAKSRLFIYNSVIFFTGIEAPPTFFCITAWTCLFHWLIAYCIFSCDTRMHAFSFLCYISSRARNWFLWFLYTSCLTLLHSAYFASTWHETLRWIWFSLQLSLKKFTKNTVLFEDIWKNHMYSL